MKLNPFSLIAIGFVLVSLVGCGGTHRDLPERNYVKGTVTLDGEPIEKGSISFASDKDVASGMPFSGNITDGTYQLQVTPGQKKVKINCIVGGKGFRGHVQVRIEVPRAGESSAGKLIEAAWEIALRSLGDDNSLS